MRTEEEPVYLGGWRSWKLDGGIEGKGAGSWMVALRGKEFGTNVVMKGIWW